MLKRELDVKIQSRRFDELIQGLRMKQLESITPTKERGKTPMKGEILMLHYNKEKPKNY